MSEPSRAVVEAVEQVTATHATRLPADWKGSYDDWMHAHVVEVARAAETAALRAAADDYVNSSSGTKARPHARSWLRARADELTDTDDRSE